MYNIMKFNGTIVKIIIVQFIPKQRDKIATKCKVVYLYTAMLPCEYCMTPS